MKEAVLGNTLPSEEIIELVQLNRKRATMYGLLSRYFKTEVDEEFFQILQEMEYPTDVDNDKYAEGNRRLGIYMESSWENSLTELAVDYVKSFIGRGLDAYAAAYPYESVYTSSKRLLMQEARDEVLAIYRCFGLDKTEDWKEGEDHIALELEFMRILCDRVDEALVAGDEKVVTELLRAQKLFLEDHLLTWVPMLTADIKRFSQTEFYQGLAYLVEGFLEIDHDFLEDVLGVESREAQAEMRA